MKPKFIVFAAVSLDGKIAAYKGQPSDWTSKEDKFFLHDFLDKSDVVLVGRKTYEVARKPLSKRNCIILTSKVSHTLQKNNRTLFCNPKKIDLLGLVKKSKYRKIAVLGGAKVYSFCLQKNLLDEMFLTIEPIIFGKGISLFDAKKPLLTNFELISFKQLNKKGSILLHFKKSF